MSRYLWEENGYLNRRDLLRAGSAAVALKACDLLFFTRNTTEYGLTSSGTVYLEPTAETTEGEVPFRYYAFEEAPGPDEHRPRIPYIPDAHALWLQEVNGAATFTAILYDRNDDGAITLPHDDISLHLSPPNTAQEPFALFHQDWNALYQAIRDRLDLPIPPQSPCPDAFSQFRTATQTEDTDCYMLFLDQHE